MCEVILATQISFQIIGGNLTSKNKLWQSIQTATIKIRGIGLTKPLDRKGISSINLI